MMKKNVNIVSHHTNLFYLAVIFLILTGVVQAQTNGNIPSQLLAWADMVLVNGKVVTIDNDGFNSDPGTTAQAMAIRDGKVLALGTTADINTMAGPDTQRIDLKGRTVVPGLIDTHSHLFDYADHPSRPRPTNLLPSQPGWETFTGDYKSWNEYIPALLAEVKQRAATQAPGTRIYLRVPEGRDVGYLWEGEKVLSDLFLQRSLALILPVGETFSDAELNSKLISKVKLDEAAPNHIVHIRFRFNGIGNTMAMDLAKSLTYGPIMDPGIIESEQTGLTNNSFNRIMVGEVFDPFMNQVKWYKQENQFTAAMGMTTWSSNIRSMTQVATYRYLEARGELGNRFGYGPSAGTAPQVLPAVLAEMGAGFNPTELRFGTEYMWYVGTGSKAPDSAYPNHTSSLEPPAIRQDIKDRETQGYIVEAMMGNLEYYISRGNRFTNTHVAGDGALDMVLDTMEQASIRGGIDLERIRSKRHVIDHCMMNPRPDQIELLRHFNMIASCAPKYLGNSIAKVAEDYGEQYTGWVVPMRSLIDGGVTAVLEIDEAITRGLFWYMDLMVNRQDLNGNVWAPEERIDRVEALKTATIWATEYIGRKSDLGSLELGKLADFIILNKDYFSVPDRMIKTVRPLMTVVGGNTVYLDPDYATELGVQAVGLQPTFALEHIAIWEAEAAAMGK
jgi:predicted amidohydrolase YtcJ